MSAVFPCKGAARRTEVFFWRTHAGREVDFILARGDLLAAVEVKWAARITDSDVAGIESCRRDLGGRLGLSVVLYSGENAFALSDHVAAVPLPLFFSGRAAGTRRERARRRKTRR